ncbi:hypothetical protein ACF8C1_15120 [Pseudomonas sp. zjy_9]
MKIRNALLMLSVFASGCASQGAWKAYSPAMSDIIGVSAAMQAEEIVIGDRVKPLGGRDMEILTRSGPELESKVTDSERSAAMEAVYEKIKVNVGVSDAANVRTSASGVLVDQVQNWAWMPIDQTFVYGGLRGRSATIDFTSAKKISAGQFVVPGVGEVNIAAKNESTYHAEINNPAVYYKVQLAKVKQTFPGLKYSNGWITEGDPLVKPIRLSDKGRSETWAIKPYQWFWKRWFGSEMPNLTLVVIDSNLFVRSTRGIESTLMPLETFEKEGRWNERSAYVGDFAVGDFERKFVVLDIKANREGEEIVIKHARIRYPEVKLDVM